MAHRITLSTAGAATAAGARLPLPFFIRSPVVRRAPEEEEAIPLGAGHIEGNRAQRFVELPVVLEALLPDLHDDVPALVAAFNSTAGCGQSRISLGGHVPLHRAVRRQSEVLLERRLRRADAQVGVVGDLQ